MKEPKEFSDFCAVVRSLTENQLSGAKPDFECLWAVHFYTEKFELLLKSLNCGF